MSQVICDNRNCGFHGGSVFCGKEFTTLNQFGMCLEVFEKNGQQKINRQPPPDCEYKGTNATEEKENGND